MLSEISFQEIDVKDTTVKTRTTSTVADSENAQNISEWGIESMEDLTK